ncbi:MAG: PAS domain S-box protein, partial [bacterium]
ALLPERAQKEIRDNAGTQFDPFLALEFLNMLEEHPSLAMGSKTGATEVRVFDSGQRAKLDGGNTLPIRYIRYTLDIDDRIIDVEDGFEALTGYSREECVGKLSQVDLVPQEDRAQYLAQVRDQFTRGDTAFLQHRLRRKDGSVINVICNGTRHFDSSVRAFRSTILVFKI